MKPLKLCFQRTLTDMGSDNMTMLNLKGEPQSADSTASLVSCGHVYKGETEAKWSEYEQ